MNDQLTLPTPSALDNEQAKRSSCAAAGYAQCPDCKAELVEAELNALDLLLNGLLMTGKNLRQCPQCRKKYLPAPNIVLSEPGSQNQS